MKRRLWLLVFSCAVVASSIVLAFLLVRPQAITAQKPCPTDPDAVAVLPEAERQHCEENLAALKIQADATEMARIEAEPHVALPVETLSPEYIKEHGTPVPAGVIPESEMFVKEIPVDDRADGPSVTRPDNAESVWRAGAVIDSRFNRYTALYIITGHQICGVGTYLEGLSKQFPNEFYECPDSKTARFVITGIDLKTYIVSLKDENGRTGTFDLVNHVWNLP